MYTLQIHADSPVEITAISYLADMILKGPEAKYHISDIQTPLWLLCLQSYRFLDSNSDDLLDTDEWRDVAFQLRKLADLIESVGKPSE